MFIQVDVANAALSKQRPRYPASTPARYCIVPLQQQQQQLCCRTWQVAGAMLTPNMHEKVVMLAALHMRLYGSAGHDTAIARRVTKEATSGESGTNTTRAWPPEEKAGPAVSELPELSQQRLGETLHRVHNLYHACMLIPCQHNLHHACSISDAHHPSSLCCARVCYPSKT